MQEIYLKDYQTQPFIIEHINLCCHLDKQNTLVQASLKLKAHPSFYGQSQYLELDGEDFEIVSLSINNQELGKQDYEYNSKKLKIKQAFKLSEDFEIEFKSSVRICPDKNLSCEGLYLSGNILTTQCESEGFRKISFFIDRPDILATFECQLIADKNEYPVLLSNGNLIEQKDCTNNRHSATWFDPIKKPCYLFALVAGRLSHKSVNYQSSNSKTITINIYVESNNIDYCDFALQCIQDAMKWDEKVFHRFYDLEVFNLVAIDYFNMGAMENKGLNIFNSSCILANIKESTDNELKRIDSIIAHEYFHNWSGNRVTLRDWFQLSLKEGFTVFRECMYMHQKYNRNIERVEHIDCLKLYQFSEDNSSLAHSVRPEKYIEIANFYTTTIYEKGAEVMQILYNLVGTKEYIKACDLYFESYDGCAATIENFIDCFKQSFTAFNLDNFIHWYEQAGTPIVEITKIIQNKKTQLNFKQSLPQNKVNLTFGGKKILLIPINIKFFDSNGKTMSFASFQTDIYYREEQDNSYTFMLNELVGYIEFDDVPHFEISALRDLSAPVHLKMDLDYAQMNFLVRHDDDAYTIWHNKNDIIKTSFKKALNTNQAFDMQNCFEIYEYLLNQLLQNNTPKIGQDIVSLCLSFPSLKELIEMFDIYPIQKAYHLRKDIMTQLAQQFKNKWCQLYERFNLKQDFNTSTQQMIGRKIQNQALGFLAYSQEFQTLIENHYQHANNMTHRLVALSIIAQQDYNHPILNEFYQSFQHNKNLINNWYRVQTSADNSQVFTKLKELMERSDFDINNPNNVYATLLVFANNEYWFHSQEEHYDFIIKHMAQIDKQNPQLSCRLAKSFENIAKLESDKQQQIKNKLASITQPSDMMKEIIEQIIDTKNNE